MISEANIIKWLYYINLLLSPKVGDGIRKDAKQPFLGIRKNIFKVVVLHSFRHNSSLNDKFTNLKTKNP
jgi:hypothetical protein